MTLNARSDHTPLELCVVVAGTGDELNRAKANAGKLDAQVRWLDAELNCSLGLPLVRVGADVVLPERWLERLLSVCTAATDQVVAVFSAHAELSPLRPGTTLEASSADIDALCFALAPRTLFIVRFEQSPVMFVPAALRAQFSESALDQMLLYCGLFATSSVLECKARPAISVEQPWYALADQLKRVLDSGKRSTLLTDPRPRLLHALHSWGGGVERFARDYAASDTHFRHFWLLPNGLHALALFGSELELFDPLDNVPLANTHLSPAIATLDLDHAGYAVELARIIQDYQIDKLLVSSLIGHGLNLLKTQLPTALVLHDYFPLWPKLHCDFGDQERRFDAVELAADSASAAPFLQQSPAFWTRLRLQYEAQLLAATVTLIAPSQSVLDNVRRMAPALSVLPAHVISHGLALWPNQVGLAPEAEKSHLQQTNGIGAPRKLKVLVPGRIAGGKGADLLARCIPELLEYCDLILLGPNIAAAPFFARSGVDVIPDYRLEDLPKLVRQIAPDLALLPRTVAETFSYSLSEMRSLGVPVLATQTGALAERIVDGVDGFLCAAEAHSLLAALAKLAAKPEQLSAVRQRLATQIEPTPALQAERYAQVLFALDVPERGSSVLPSAITNTLALSQSIVSRLQTELELGRQKFTAMQQESIKRGEWGRKTSEQLHARSQWAQTLVAELERLNEQSGAVNAAHTIEIEHLKTLVTEMQAQLIETESQVTQANLATIRVAAELERTANRLHIAHQDYQAILQSSSWKLTRPLRVAMRAKQQLLSRLIFQMRRAKTLVTRGISSLRTRGFSATLQRVWRKDAPLLHPVTLALPVLPEKFAAYHVAGTVASDAGSIAVSIVIPVYNKFNYTDTCLRSLSADVSKLRVEIIVVDDCSTDAETWQNLSEISGIRAIKNPQNLGFIGACNAGAAAANGEFIVFLNNDTAVQAGWLDALIATFDARPDAGLVGAKLVYPDGRLQESGGIIFNDGSGWNYGRFADPNDPQYGFVREVDYCSGAAIALRKSLFDEFGGFDTLYAPAYYEDTDLAFKVRQAGLKCYVQPISVVVHFEGISSGTDLTSGIKRYQVINQAKFLARWAEVLKTHPAPPPKTAIAVASQHRAKKFILVVDAVTPMPDQDSGSLRMVNLLTILVNSGCAVTFFCEGRHYHSGYAEKLQALGIQVLYHPYLQSEPTWLAENGARFDSVLLSRHYIAAPLLALVREHCRRARIIFDTVDLHFLREERQAELAGDAAMARAALKTRAQELAVITASDLTLVVSPIEQVLLKELLPLARVEILSNIHEVPGCAAGYAARAGLLFVGGFQHPPNVDAVLWFVREVLPLARAKLAAALLPEFVLHLVGSNTPAEIAVLSCDYVIVHGFVRDIDPLLAAARLSVAPLRYGAGVKGKVNMAMAHGLPVIATGAAVEGMHCSHGTDVMIGDCAQEFADALVQTYQDPELWQRLSEGGLRNVSTHFSFDAAKAVVERVFGLGAG